MTILNAAPEPIPSLSIALKAAAKTDVGLVRRSNQDSFGLDDALGLYVVCDGMGGAAGGEIASNLAVQTFLQTARQELGDARLRNDERVRSSLLRATAAANRAVRMRGQYDSALRGMGTTLVGICIIDTSAIFVNVGDSRAYLVREGLARQMTVDHSYVAESVRRGLMTIDEAAVSPMHSVITRAVGAEDDVDPDLFTAEVLPGDTILLSSDGLTRHLSEAEIAAILSAADQSAVECCRRLIEAAKNDGGSDNVTCLVLRITDAMHPGTAASGRKR